MQILGIYLETADSSTRKNLKEKQWYGFNSNQNWHELFNNKKSLKKQIIEIENSQNFTKFLYNYNYEESQLSVNCIVGKNGSGKSTLINIYHHIINNFSSEIKNKFPEFNQAYDIQKIEGLTAELYYENNKLIYKIRIENKKVIFSNNKYSNLFLHIRTLKDFSNHFFYTISTNYSIYSETPEWIDNLYHKNDGYFTPIVLVPYKNKGVINIEREKELSNKRTQTLAILLQKEGNKFIEKYSPHKIEFKLKTEEYYKINKEIFTGAKYEEIESYEHLISLKIKDLRKSLENQNIYNEAYGKPILFQHKDFPQLQKSVEKYWDKFFSTNDFDLSSNLRNYCKHYLIYKTIKVCINYEVITKKIILKKLDSSIDKIIKLLWNENNLNYINLKIIMCKKFMEYSYHEIYNSKNNDTLLLDDVFYKKIANAKTYDQVFINLLPDFFETKFYYSNNKKSEQPIQLSQMSSGEQQLYNSLSYTIYHIKNAVSNVKGIAEKQIPYKYFNLIFDEAELYYHPEYQRRFLNNLIDILNRSNLTTNGINITIITHSPFILSDISTENVLALKNGIPYDIEKNTLGANFYDLLKNQFFMDSPLGSTIEKKIIKIINSRIDYDNNEDLKSEIINDFKTNIIYYQKFESLLGDDFFRKNIKDIINYYEVESKKCEK